MRGFVPRTARVAGNCHDAEIPNECDDGATETRTCGSNGTGTETRSCVGGTWSDYGDCTGGEFQLTIRVEATDVGSGTLEYDGNDCASGCVVTVAKDATVQIDAVAHRYGELQGWSEATCSGATCSVTVTQDMTVEASFNWVHNVVFSTVGSYNGNLSGLDDADAICLQEAKDAGLHHAHVVPTCGIRIRTLTLDSQQRGCRASAV